jgi:hypothetical protein
MKKALTIPIPWGEGSAFLFVPEETAGAFTALSTTATFFHQAAKLKVCARHMHRPRESNRRSDDHIPFTLLFSDTFRPSFQTIQRQPCIQVGATHAPTTAKRKWQISSCVRMCHSNLPVAF